MIPHKNIIIGGNIRLISFILRCFSTFRTPYKHDSLCMRSNAEFVFMFLGSPKSRSLRHNNQMLQSNKMARVIRLLTAAALYAVHCACVVLVQSLEPSFRAKSDVEVTYVTSIQELYVVVGAKRSSRSLEQGYKQSLIAFMSFVRFVR